jgi:hypothetical protein
VLRRDVQPKDSGDKWAVEKVAGAEMWRCV